MNATPPDDTGSTGSPATAQDGLRFALGTLTVLPVRVARWDRDTARHGMVWAPLAGLVVGLAAAAAGAVLLALGTSALLAAVVSLAVPAVLTRGLHLDGLADVADGLGSGKPAEDALRIMKQSDIGPFGVLTLVFVLLAQVAVVSELYAEDGWAHGALAVVVAAVTARTALTLAARSGVPGARPEGLGATVAGTVPVRTAVAVAAAVTVLSALAGAAVPWGDALYGAVPRALAVVLGVLAAELLLRHCRRRLGGVTGDVFGALAETAATASLVVLALG
ncbi:MAG: adenosylcobinamide-GDP ribazoletransferase [Streptomyces sp.]|uniref:adenosylcobinamide-GDP ribazoletransferase n=1 Tax=Streptomyces sp. TaxID=1931 RepID=UPI003D6C0661